MDVLTPRRKNACCWSLFLWIAVPLWAQTGSEFEVKAAFLYKFASFVEWPHDARNLPVFICVAGQDPFGGALDRVVKGKTINGREFVIRRLKSGDAVGECHILFISGSERKRLRMALDRVQSAPVLTVGDMPEFCENGGAINFGVSDNRVQLEINPGATERAGLQVSSRLLSLAKIVREAPMGSR
jgi:YfiR/HmsC-like